MSSQLRDDEPATVNLRALRGGVFVTSVAHVTKPAAEETESFTTEDTDTDRVTRSSTRAAPHGRPAPPAVSGGRAAQITTITRTRDVLGADVPSRRSSRDEAVPLIQPPSVSVSSVVVLLTNESSMQA
jgi:hypothetical protein